MAVPEDLLVHLRRARDLIDRCYADPLALDDLAAVSSVSRFHFLRCFAAVYGCDRCAERTLAGSTLAAPDPPPADAATPAIPEKASLPSGA